MEQEGLIYSRPGRGSFVTPAVGEQRTKQQEEQINQLQKEMKKAREMGIPRERMELLVREAYENGETGESS